MQYQVLARKYRPKQLHDVVGQQHVVQTLENALRQQRLHHAYLFTGTRGIGKTTLARIFAKCLSCETGITPTPCDQCGNCAEIDAGRFPDFFEVDAASRTKVEDTRELLENIQYSPCKGRYKIYLIDEVHMLSGHSFNALLKTLEEPPEHVKFLLATTDPQKLPATVLSRCLQFHLGATSPEQAADHLEKILQQENIHSEKSALKLLGHAAEGSMRDALSLLDQCIAFGNGQVLEKDVKTLLGTIEPTLLFEILTALAQRDGDVLLQCIDRLSEQGADFNTTLSSLLTLLHQINVLQIVPTAPCEEYVAEKQALAKILSAEDVQLFYQIGVIGRRDFHLAPSPRIAFEMTLLRMLAFYPEMKSPAKAALPEKSVQQITKPQTSPSSDWSSLVAHLSLTGAAAILAENCNLEKLTDTQVVLTINEKQRALASTNTIQRVSEALSKYLGRPITVKIQVGQQSQTTPREQQQKLEASRKQSAKITLKDDPTVQQLIKAFDATLIEESIQPHPITENSAGEK